MGNGLRLGSSPEPQDTETEVFTVLLAWCMLCTTTDWQEKSELITCKGCLWALGLNFLPKV